MNTRMAWATALAVAALAPELEPGALTLAAGAVAASASARGRAGTALVLCVGCVLVRSALALSGMSEAGPGACLASGVFAGLACALAVPGRRPAPPETEYEAVDDSGTIVARRK